MKQHILVVDDDSKLRRLLKKYLTNNDFIVTTAESASQAEELMDLFNFSLITLDMMMPGETGLEFTKRLRQNHNETPILMLTAMGDTFNRIEGLEAGADDYLPKPFEPKELLLRINNILKHHSLKMNDTLIYFGDCCYNPKTLRLTHLDEPVILTGAEQELIKLLVQKIGTPVSREELAQLLQTDNERTVDVQITRLRKKIETDIKKPLCIQTLRGQGYMLVPK